MSMNKLKLNSKKRDQSKPPMSKQQKLKQLNGQIIQSLSKQNNHNKSNDKKLSLINMMSNQMQANFFSLNKKNLFQGSQTDRIRKFEKIQYPINQIKLQRGLQNDQSINSEQNHKKSASHLLDSLNSQIEKQNNNEEEERQNKKRFVRTVSVNDKGIKEVINFNKQEKQKKTTQPIKQPLTKHTIDQSASQQSVIQTQESADITETITNNHQSMVQQTSIFKEQQSLQTKVQPQKINVEAQQQSNSPSKNKLVYKAINQVEILILQQNKLLIQQVQSLRKQRDNLLFSNKRFQVQLMQSNNKDYYQRQTTRLKLQVEQLQCINQQLKHTNFILQNKTKQLQSSDQVNKRQIKRIIKQLQQSKLQSTKQRYQNKQKSKTLQELIKKLQQNNQELSQKFQNYYNKSQEQQKILKVKIQQQSKYKKIIDSYQSKLIHLEKLTHQKRKLYQEEIEKFNRENSEVVNNFRNFKRQSEAEVQNLKQNIKQLNLKRDSEVLLLQSRTKFLQKHNNTIQAQLQVVRLEETLKQLKEEVEKRSSLIKQLNGKIDSMISMKDYEQLRLQCEHLSKSKLAMAKEYQGKILIMREEINLLNGRIAQKDKKIQQQSSLVNTNQGNATKQGSATKSSTQQSNFKQILKQQIQQCDNLKQQLFKKNQIIFSNKQQLQQINIKFSTLRNQHEILKKQHNSFENNSKIKKQILQQQLVNEIQTFKRKLQVLQKRYQSKINQNKQKQTFITNYIVGKSSQNVDANYLLKELQRVFLEKQKNIILSSS